MKSAVTLLLPLRNSQVASLVSQVHLILVILALGDRKGLLQADTTRREEWQHQRDQEVDQEQCITGP